MVKARKMFVAASIAAAATLSLAGVAGAAVDTSKITPTGGTFAPNDTTTVTGTAGAVSANAQVVISLCRNANIGASFNPQNDCDFTSAVNTLDPAGADGSFSDSFTFVVPSAWGSACTVSAPCRLRINTGVFNDTADQAFISNFVVQAAPTTTTTQATTTTTTQATTTTTTPEPVVPEVPLNIMIPLGGGAVLSGAYFLVRRGRTA